METNKRLYPATQLIVALDSRVLKVYLWILSWSASKGETKYYPKQFAKACKLTEGEVDRCIQTLIDTKLINITNYGGDNWNIAPNAEQNQKYYTIPISKVIEGNGINMADKATWNKSTVEEESDDDIQRQILMLQARLNERQQLKKKVVQFTASKDKDDVIDDLPF